jgi:hypothetical protein
LTAKQTEMKKRMLSKKFASPKVRQISVELDYEGQEEIM